MQGSGAPGSGRLAERGVLHGQQSGVPVLLSDPVDCLHRPESQVDVETPVTQDVLPRYH